MRRIRVVFWLFGAGALAQAASPAALAQLETAATDERWSDGAPTRPSLVVAGATPMPLLAPAAPAPHIVSSNGVKVEPPPPPFDDGNDGVIIGLINAALIA